VYPVWAFRCAFVAERVLQDGGQGRDKRSKEVRAYVSGAAFGHANQVMAQTDNRAGNVPLGWPGCAVLPAMIVLPTVHTAPPTPPAATRHSPGDAAVTHNRRVRDRCL